MTPQPSNELLYNSISCLLLFGTEKRQSQAYPATKKFEVLSRPNDAPVTLVTTQHLETRSGLSRNGAHPSNHFQDLKLDG